MIASHARATRRWLALVMAGLLLAGTAASAARPVISLDAAAGRAHLLAQMSLEDKVGQLFLLTIYSTNFDQADRLLLANTHPGGVVLFPMNIDSPPQVTALINRLQEFATTTGAGLPLFVAVDQEGGVVRRLQDGFSPFPSILMLGAAAERADAIQIGYAMGQEMAAVGINMNLAPVADLHSVVLGQEHGGVMYRRTFGADPVLVGTLAGAMVEGMRAAGVIGVLKHFPGHGAATQDSHAELPRVDLPRDTVEQTALAAFQGAIDQGAPAIMFGHLYYSALDPGVLRPATLSPVVTDLLRATMGFQGVTISDAMDMGAILEDYSMSDAVIAAINAGMDIIAFGPHVTALDQQVVIRDTIQAVYDGRISMARLDEAVGRALALRDEFGLMQWQALPVEGVDTRLNLRAHADALVRLALDAVTVLDDPGGLLPLDPAASRVALIYPGQYRAILDACWALDPDLQPVGVSYEPGNSEIAAAVAAAQNADVAVLFVEDIDRNRQQYNLAWALPGDKTIAVTMRSPYDWEDLPEPLTTVLLTYDSIPAAHLAACRVLYGVAPARGRLPVPVGPYPAGAGVLYDAVRSLVPPEMP